ncbi:MAG: hypothetical protein H7144_15105 [Burkholderiales bacterium]|nr:hypothetical protein [Phycisphaerae bacterium]
MATQSVFWKILLLAVVVGAMPLSPAQAQPKPVEKPKPIVTVTKLDNTTVRGWLIEYDADRLTVEVGPKPGSGEIVPVEWSAVSKVSNGLTQAKALDEWKAANKDNLCETCHGNRGNRCPTCHGTGHDHASSKDCAKCHGEGQIKCAAPRCKEGKIPCTGKCIKLSEGTWAKGAEGKTWRSIRWGNVELKVSSLHVGEIFELENNVPVSRGPCPVCGGKAQLDCAKCQASGFATCATCLAAKDAPDCADCEAGRVACATCKGTGLKPPAQ